MSKKNGWVLWLVLGLALLPLLPGAWADQPVATEAGPLISPEEMLSVDQVRPGMKGHGLSVFEGTKIERFNVTVLGVLRKIDFGGDMILIRIDDGIPVTSRAGVSSGMSGSPIYVDGKLIGALAFAWPFAKDPVAGVTPIAQMLENYRPGSAPPAVAQSGVLRPDGGPLKLDGKLFARAEVVPERGLAAGSGSGTLYLTPVSAPLMVSGMGRTALDELRRRWNRYPVLVQPGPGAVQLPPGERPKLEPGAAVGVQLLGGDVDATAIGTVTYVKGNHVLAFGHPMFGLGTIDMPMTTAFIHGVISTQEVSFKMGAPVETVGHITQDRNWSIGGRVGETARTVQAEFSVADRDRGVKRDYRVVSAVHRDMTPNLLYSSLLNAVGSVSPPMSGTTRGVMEVWPKGMPVIRRENVFSVGERRSALEQLFGDPFAGLPMVELLQVLDVLENNTFGSVPIERLRVAVEVSEKRQTATIERAYADRKRVKPGEKVKIGVVIQPTDGTREVRELEVEIPRNIPGGRLQIGVSGGGGAERVRQFMQINRPPAKTLAQMLDQITDREQNNELCLEVAQPVVGVSVAGREFPNLPNVVVEVLTGANPSGIRMIRSHDLRKNTTPWVLAGAQILTLQVDADEKDKTGPALAPGAAGSFGLGSLLDLFRQGFGGELQGEIGGDETGVGGPVGALPFAQGPQKRPSAAPDLPNEPAMPSFEELQRLLEGETPGGATGSEGGTATTIRKGLARAPGVWRMSTAQDLQGGKLEGVLISSRGELALAPKASPLLSSPDRFFWAQAGDRSGNVYVGGWLEGSILKIDSSGTTSRYFEGQGEIAISALTVDDAGTLFASAEPSGTIYRIDPSGRASALCRLPGERVWVLRKQGDVLYAGTGSQGHLYRITMDGKATAVFTAPDRHVFALTGSPDGTLYIGTYPRGKLFRLRNERVEPVYELPNSTVTALAGDARGNLYVGTSPRASVVRIDPSGNVSTLFQSKEKHVFGLIVDPDGSVYAGVGTPARVYRIAPDRTVSTLWEPQAAYVLSLTRDASGSLCATTAGPTQIVRLGARPSGTGSYVSRVLDAGNLARWGTLRWNGSTDGLEIQTRTGNTGYPDATWSDWSAAYRKSTGETVSSPAGQYLQYRVVLRSQDGGQAAGAGPKLRSMELFYRPRNRAPEVTLTAPAAGAVLSGTRAIRWRGKDPDGDHLTYDLFYAGEGSNEWVKIGTRTPKSSDEPDELDLEASTATSPARSPRTAAKANVTRRPTFATRNARTPQPTPTARRTHNLQPLARRVPNLQPSTFKPSNPALTSRQTVPASAPKVPNLQPSTFQPSIPAPKQGIRGKVVLQGPQVGVASAGADVESEIDISELLNEAAEAEDLPGGPSSLNWNTKKVPDGRYRLKVVASDAYTSPDEAATAEVISEVVQIDNSGPRIYPQRAFRKGLAPPAEVPVEDQGAYIASAEYRVDEGDWIAAASSDGIFDSAQETLRIDVARLTVGRHTLEVRARDAAGNEATVRIPYLLQPQPTGTAPAPLPVPVTVKPTPWPKTNPAAKSPGKSGAPKPPPKPLRKK